MKARIQALSARFAALSRREQLMVAAAGLVVVAMGGFAIWVEPARTRAAAIEKQLVQQRQDGATLREQLSVLKAQLANPESERKDALAKIRGELAALERERKAHEDMLVPPRRMPQLLQSLLSRHRGLELVGLRTLAPVAMIERRKEADAKSPAPRAAEGANLYRHGVEITVAGSYRDLLAYVTELEQSQHKFLWEKMSLAVKDYPRSELTLSLYTISLEATWLVL